MRMRGTGRALLFLAAWMASPQLSGAADIGAWHIPMNSSGSKVALFSEQREPFSIYNRSAAPLRIQSLELSPGVEAVAEELTLQNTELAPKPLIFAPVTLAPQKSFDFYVRYFPVQSRTITATITVGYGEGKKEAFAISGSGRDNALFAESFTLATHKVFGGANTDEMITGMVADASGGVFFAGQATGVRDRFAHDLFYGKIAPDGSLAWAKLWNGPFRDYSRDPGQNEETGGSANAIDVDEDGDFYLCGSHSPDQYNNNFAALVVKVSGRDGSILWEKVWRPDWPDRLVARHGAGAYALDVNGGGVLVVGTTGGAVEEANALALILCLSAKDGSILFQRTVDPTPRSTDRAYAVHCDGRGNAYVGGIAARTSLLIKLSGVATAQPKVTWVKTLDTGLGSSINSLDVDAAGNVYAAIDRRGAQTFLSFLKLSPEGELLWGRTYDGGANDNNNTGFIKVAGDAVYAGGRTGQSAYDAQMGDGKLIKASALDGQEIWSAFYYGGKGPTTLAEHRLKGLAVVGQSIYVLGQVYTGNANGVRYWGYWYKGVSKLTDYRPKVTDLGLGEGSGKDIPAGAVREASALRELVDLSRLWVFQNAPEKRDGVPPDGQMIYWKLTAR